MIMKQKQQTRKMATKGRELTCRSHVSRLIQCHQEDHPHQSDSSKMGSQLHPQKEQMLTPSAVSIRQIKSLLTSSGLRDMEGKTYYANRLLYLDVTRNMGTTSRNKNGVTGPSTRYMEISHNIRCSQ